MMRSIERNRKRKKQRLKKTNDKPQNNPIQSPLNSVELPEELIFSEILPRLPVNSLTRFKSVSKTWNFIISTPNFINSHLKCTISNPFVPSNCVFIKSAYDFYILNYSAYDRYPNDNYDEKGLIKVKSLHFDDNGVNTFLIGSCNGLVCFGRGTAFSKFGYNFRVYNPVMGQFLHVSDPLGNFQGKLIFGFGFVSCKNDYLLLVGGLQRKSYKNFVYIYSLRSNDWKKIGAFDEDEFSIYLGGRGVLVKETLHWVTTQVRRTNAKCISGFDLVDESFKDVKMPRVFWRNDHFMDFKLSEMNGSLCAWGEDIYGGVEMWMLIQYGVWDSWTKLFKIDMIPGLDNFYGCLDSGKVLVQTNDGCLLLADPDQGQPRFMSLVKDLGDIEVVNYIRSPISPFS
ncbi:F-box/kelch-repeat protein At3g06240-like isoform X1 [Chenopodium quinoa]|uniref:F-box/kelch-repeat protein At3g06240-like isoform X1 n=1 Tax=Chenopodium quinoa TaxID=63459 RepID=UPI000B785067|nr:F-box/kelch-repeat protein At3g06240-like isoform X1 [Chenopodium quinoa]